MSSKERDSESGYDYFGARYYDHRKGIWNSVDPLADKNLNVTPYLYCNGNPIILVDPDGREKKILVASGNYLASAEDELNPSTALVIYAHGSALGIKDEVTKGEESWAGGASVAAERISTQSETFNNDAIKDKVIILSACQTRVFPAMTIRDR